MLHWSTWLFCLEVAASAVGRRVFPWIRLVVAVGAFSPPQQQTVCSPFQDLPGVSNSESPSASHDMCNTLICFVGTTLWSNIQRPICRLGFSWGGWQFSPASVGLQAEEQLLSGLYFTWGSISRVVACYWELSARTTVHVLLQSCSLTVNWSLRHVSTAAQIPHTAGEGAAGRRNSKAGWVRGGCVG